MRGFISQYLGRGLRVGVSFPLRHHVLTIAAAAVILYVLFVAG